MVHKFCIILMSDYNYLPYLGWYKLKHTLVSKSLLHSDYYIASFATPPKKTKFNAFTNKNQAYEAYELNI